MEKEEKGSCETWEYGGGWVGGWCGVVMTYRRYDLFALAQNWNHLCSSEQVPSHYHRLHHHNISVLQINRIKKIPVCVYIHLHIKKIVLRNWLTWFWGLVRLKYVGQDGNLEARRSCCCSLQAEFLLLLETSVFVLKAWTNYQSNMFSK